MKINLKTKIINFILLGSVGASIVFTIILCVTAERTMMRGVDDKLLTAVTIVKAMLPPDYHDNIIDANSVSPEEYRRIVDRFNQICVKLQLQYLWSNLKIGDDIYFTTATSPDKITANHKHAAFFEIHRDPGAFTEVFKRMKPTFSEFENEWGRGKMVLVPFRDSHGRKYCFGASMSVDYVDALVQKTLIQSLAVSFLVFLGAFGVSLFLASGLSRSVAEIAQFARSLAEKGPGSEIHVKGSTEIVSLCRSLNRMSRVMLERETELHRHRERLEDLVEEKTASIKAIVDTAADGIITIDVKGRVLTFNPAAEKMFGYKAQEVIGQNVNMLMGAPHRRAHDGYIKRYLETGQTRVIARNSEVHGQGKNGEQFPIHIAVSEMIVGKKKQFTGILRDVTQIKKTQKDLVRAKEGAEAANRAKSEFLANMSHEIRTPMNSILGFTTILEEQITNKQQKQYIALIRSSGEALLTLINDILDLSKIEAGKVELAYEAINPIAIFEEVIELFSQKAAAKGLNLTLHSDVNMPSYLLLDEIRLRQILLNLVGNAVKFTPSGSINLNVQALKYEGDNDWVDFIFSVADTGIGIPEEQREAIFKAFEQQRGLDHTQYGGTGLGLAITKRLVNMMGGRVALSGEQGQGSLFTVTLPRVRLAAAPPSDDVSHEELSSPNAVIFDHARLLVVDDLSFNLTLIRAMLEEFDFEIIEARDGRQAVDLARRLHPDLILMDMKMPVMDGRQASQILKAGQDTRDIPIIAITADVMSKTMEEVKSLCDGFVGKPIQKNILIEQLARFLKHSTPASEKSVLENGPSHKNETSTACSFDAESPQEISGLVSLLKTSFLPRWREIDEMLVVEDVMEFAADLEKVGREYEICLITDYFDVLQQSIEDYDVIGIKAQVAKFPEMVAEIEQMQKRRPS